MEDERKGRLSFSDLQFFSDDLQVDSKVSAVDEKQNSFSSPSSSSNHDFLGFFSAEWSDSPTSISSNASAPGDIIFCGKVIHTSKTNQNSKPKNKTDSENKKTDSKNNKSSIIGRNCNSFSSFSNGHSSLSTLRLSSLPISWREKMDNKKNERLVKRTTKVACPTKSRWQVFMFGSGRFPTKMELSDIRSRQLRQNHSEEEEKTGGKRLSGMLRVLGCGGGFSVEMMKDSLGYIPPC